MLESIRKRILVGDSVTFTKADGGYTGRVIDVIKTTGTLDEPLYVRYIRLIA